jgi:hypothetical protein
MSALLSFDPSFRRSLFDLVLATACADPMMCEVHIDAVRGVQVALGLVDERVLGLTDGSTHRSEWRDLERGSERERSIAYAAAVWIALADDVVDDEEERFLLGVRRMLGLSDPGVRLAEALARRVISVARTEKLPPHRSFTRLVVEAARHEARRRALRAA